MLGGGLWAQNKKQVVQTPFGPVVREAVEAPAPRRSPDLSLIRVEEKGEQVTFRRKTPFGDSVWTRRRADLTAFEKEILAAQPAAARK